MANNRSDMKFFPFFDSAEHPVSQPGTSDSFHNYGYNNLTLEVIGTAAGRVEGCVNIINTDGTTKTDDQCTWSTLATLDLKDFNVAEGFSAAGVYAIGIGGISRVRVVLTSVTGTAQIVGFMGV